MFLVGKALPTFIIQNVLNVLKLEYTVVNDKIILIMILEKFMKNNLYFCEK